MLKAFTKLYAMAGLRLGYGLCADGELMERLKQVRQPWSVSSVAQAAGLAALGETGYVRASTEAIARERRWLSGELTRLGLTVYGSEANYIFFRDPAGADQMCIRDRCRQYYNEKNGKLVEKNADIAERD